MKSKDKEKEKLCLLEDVLISNSSSLSINKLEGNYGEFDLYGAKGLVKKIDFFQQDQSYIAIIKDGAGVGRVSIYPPKSSIVGTMQYLIPKNNNNLKLLYYFLKTVDFSKFVSGATIPHIYFKDYKKEPFILFPIQEQNTIAAGLEKVDILTKKIQSEITHQQTLLKKLRQSILQEAIEGKLTQDWRIKNPDIKPASVLLEKIKTEKTQLIKDKKIKQQKPLPPIKNDEMPFTIPDSWAWCRLNDISLIGTGATPLTSNNMYYENGNINWVTSSATGDDYVFQSEKKITEKAILETNCNINPMGTLIIAMYGQGKTRGQITELMIESATNQACATINPYYKDKSLTQFLKKYFNKIYLEIRKLATGGSQPNLNMLKIRKTVIPLPPLAEQKQIVKKIESLFKICDQLETQIKQSKTNSQNITQAVLKEAFAQNDIN